MDDSGVADAFYTVLSIGIVLVAALAVSGVVLSATVPRENAMPAGGGMEPGLYSFCYAVDGPRSDYRSGDPNDIVLRRLARDGVDRAIAFNASTAPPSAPGTMGAVLWSGFLYAPADGDYELRLSSLGPAWLWVDGHVVMDNRFSDEARSQELRLELSKGYHAVKAKYFYRYLGSASCTLSWKQGTDFTPVRSFYR